MSTLIAAQSTISNSPECVVIAGMDLLFASKVRGATEPHGLSVASPRDLNGFATKLAQAALVIVDVTGTRFDPLEAIAQAATLRETHGYRYVLVGVGPHVEGERLEAARTGGCDEVYTRSEFTAQLPALVERASSVQRDTSAGEPCCIEQPCSIKKSLERGAGKFTVLVFGAITVAVLYTAYNVMPFYYYYYELQNHFEQVISVASTESDQEIRRRLMYYINKYELPVVPEELLIEREGRTMHIRLAYEEVFAVDWGEKEYILYRFPFVAESYGEF